MIAVHDRIYYRTYEIDLQQHSNDSNESSNDDDDDQCQRRCGPLPIRPDYQPFKNQNM